MGSPLCCPRAAHEHRSGQLHCFIPDWETSKDIRTYKAVAGSGKVGPVNQVYHTSWVAVVTPTDRPKSVRNRCVIELFVASLVLSLCPLDISVGAGAFFIGLSQISSFFSC